jgi:hypothetical protein
MCEILWIRRLLTELGFAPTSEMEIFCDINLPLRYLTIQSNMTVQSMWKWIGISSRKIWKVICFPFVKSEDQLADILTKAVSSKEFYNSLDKLCMRDLYAST